MEPEAAFLPTTLQNAWHRPTCHCAAPRSASRPSSRGPGVHVLPCCNRGAPKGDLQTGSKEKADLAGLVPPRQLHCQQTQLGVSLPGLAPSARRGMGSASGCGTRVPRWALGPRHVAAARL